MDLSEAQGSLPSPEGGGAAAPAPPPVPATITGETPPKPNIAPAPSTSDAFHSNGSGPHTARPPHDGEDIIAIAKNATASPGLTVSGAPRGEPAQPGLLSATPSVRGAHTQRGSGSGRGGRTSLPVAEDSIMADSTPGSGSATRGRSTGRPRGSRARGTTRGGTRGGRGGKRKRTKDDDEDGDDTSDSEIITPSANTTKSGRNVQKPTSFVPPPMPSPTAQPSYKKRKPQRRNFESAVCKVCLRGVSPASNMIVFCDACSTAYHRYCHHPPIDQSVIDEVDKEWYCRPCERERIEPVPEEEVLAFISGAGASADERQKYFSTLPPGLLVTLLTRATTLQPDLPVFDPTFQPKDPIPPTSTNTTTDGRAPFVKPSPAATASLNGTPSANPTYTAPTTIIRDMDDSDGYGSDEHPRHYPRPGHGLMRELGPESADLHYLVDDENSKGVFTHLYRDDGQPATAGASADADT